MNGANEPFFIRKKATKMKNTYSSRGMTLIEIVVSLAILGVLIASFLGVFTSGYRYITKAGDQSVISFQNQESIEALIKEQGPGSNLTLDFIDSSAVAAPFSVSGIRIFEGEFNNFLPGISGTSISVTGISGLPNTYTLPNIGATYRFSIDVEPADASNRSVTWDSSNESVVTVANGLVYAVASGTATITVTTIDGGYTDSVVITVVNALLSSDTTLSNLVLSDGSFFTPAFQPNVTNYIQTGTGTPPTVDATKNHPDQFLSYHQATDRSGDNVATIIVTAANRINTRTYTVTFNAGSSSTDALLSSLTLSDGSAITPSFNPSIYEYKQSVSNTGTPPSVIPTNSSGATIVTQQATDRISNNVATIFVTAQDGITTSVYHVTFYSSDATLSNLKLKTGTLTKIDEYHYVQNANGALPDILATPTHPNAVINIITSATTRTAPTNISTIVVTATDGVTKLTYYVTYLPK